MRDLRAFRDAVREHRRAVGRTQEQLARSVGLHPHVLSHKLNGHGQAMLSTREVVAIATTLADWGALATRAEVHALLAVMAVPPHAVPAEAWACPPLAGLPAGQDTASAGRAPPARAGAPPGRPRLTLSPLPVPATPLIGRERERAQVAAALAASRLVTLTGPGGTGKTRLALQAAVDASGGFADGVAFVDLAPVRDPVVLVTTVAQAVGLSPGSAESAEAELAGALRGRVVLLVLDNLEQLLEAAGLLARLLAAAPGLRLLVTSRIALRLYGEYTLRVPPLRLPADAPGTPPQGSEAVQLFVARAQAAQPGFAPDAAETAAISAICTALDGLPLAIELAATKARLYAPQAVVGLLDSRLALLTGGPRDAPGRQQTLRATLDWSHALLPAPAQQLFAFLGVFAGPFDVPAAVAVSAAHDPAGMLDQLADLADQGLLEITAAQTPSFRMLQTIREYALARLAETGEQDAARRRHLAYHLSVAVAAREGMEGRPGQAEWLDRLELAYPNFRSALEFACTQAGREGGGLGEGLRLAAALWYFWDRRGPLAEGALYLDRLLALDGAQHAGAPADRAAAMLAAGWLACFKGDHPRAAELARQCAERYAALDDHDGLAWTHLLLAEAALAVGDDDAAEPHFQRVLTEASQAGSLRNQAEAHNGLGSVARHRGEFRRASALLGRALQLYQAGNYPSHAATVLGSLGEVARDQGQPRQARRFYRAALSHHAVSGDKRQIAYSLEGFAAIAALEHAGQQALVYLGAAQALREEAGGPLPPVEQAILTRILEPAVAALPAGERQDALSEGRNQTLPAIITRALQQPPHDQDDAPLLALPPEPREDTEHLPSAWEAQDVNSSRPG